MGLAAQERSQIGQPNSDFSGRQICESPFLRKGRPFSASHDGSKSRNFFSSSMGTMMKA
jgi:hypothetical protein